MVKEEEGDGLVYRRGRVGFRGSPHTLINSHCPEHNDPTLNLCLCN